MDKIKALIALARNRKQLVLIVVLSFALARAVVALTPSEVDDAWVNKTYATVSTFLSLFGSGDLGSPANAPGTQPGVNP